MSVPERLRQTIDEQQRRLRASVPAGREAAILALIRTIDRRPATPAIEPLPDLITGRQIANLGANKALQLCLESAGDAATASSGEGLDGWAERFLDECGRIAEAGLVLSYCETGIMRIVDDRAGTFDAWIATKRAPTSWRERADFDWWAESLSSQFESELVASRSERQAAGVYVKMMAHQLGYPAATVIDGCSVKTYLDVLGWLIARALAARERGEAQTLQSDRLLVSEIASSMRVDPATVARAVAAFTLDEENAAYHAAVPGVAAAPLVRIDADRLVWSLDGLTTQPLLFLTRELRRRAAEDYHNSSRHRETVFRQDLYRLFADKRFVTSPDRIELRRESGNVRTDIDAVVFDLKTGTLGVFELKSQDPFARSTAELMRQRDNLLYANRQVSSVLAWLQRYGANELLKRVDARTAKTFRAHKVYPFVLGRYLAHFNDGPEPDKRAAWGTWPHVLRLLDEQPALATVANPIASLFNRMSKDTPLVRVPEDDTQREISVGEMRLIVHSSYAEYRSTSR